MLKVIIVDDEELGRNVLKSLLQKFCPNIELLGEAKNSTEAIKLIQELKPELVFLDIEMPGGSGFDLLEKIGTPSFSVVFTTAFDQYAIKAIKFSAMDYLLKPINIEELVESIRKVEQNKLANNPETLAKHLIENLKRPIGESQNIALPTSTGLEFINIKDIIRCEADGKYTKCFFKDGKKSLSTKNLKEFDDLLSSHNFFRVHHAHLVNVEHIKNFNKTDGGTLTMSNGDIVSISKRKKEEFLSSLKKI
jgi:two-component system LytT family response regulator